MSKPYTRIEYRIVGPNAGRSAREKEIPGQEPAKLWINILVNNFAMYAKHGKKHTLQRRLVAYSDWEDLESV